MSEQEREDQQAQKGGGEIESALQREVVVGLAHRFVPDLKGLRRPLVGDLRRRRPEDVVLRGDDLVPRHRRRRNDGSRGHHALHHHGIAAHAAAPAEHGGADHDRAVAQLDFLVGPDRPSDLRRGLDGGCGRERPPAARPLLGADPRLRQAQETPLVREIEDGLTRTTKKSRAGRLAPSGRSAGRRGTTRGGWRRRWCPRPAPRRGRRPSKGPGHTVVVALDARDLALRIEEDPLLVPARVAARATRCRAALWARAMSWSSSVRLRGAALTNRLSRMRSQSEGS